MTMACSRSTKMRSPEAPSAGDLLLGLAEHYVFCGHRTSGQRRGAPQTGLYLQDEWQVNNRLTINAEACVGNC